MTEWQKFRYHFRGYIADMMISRALKIMPEGSGKRFMIRSFLIYLETEQQKINQD